MSFSRCCHIVLRCVKALLFCVGEGKLKLDTRAIGVFDSGLGGLTTVKKLSQYLPSENIIYLGDTGRVPYGPRSRDTIIRYAQQDAAFLAGFDIKAMVIACNTACSVAYEDLTRQYEMPVYEVVSAPAKAAAEATQNGKIGVIGTAATIRSGVYEAAIRGLSSELEVHSQACPLFVPLAENGRTSSDDVAALAIAGDYLEGVIKAGVDTLIMGCTHYPLLRGVISKVVGPGVRLIDSGAETARMAAEDLAQRDMLCGAEKEGTIKYFVTDSIDGFAALASQFLESEVHGLVEQVTIE